MQTQLGSSLADLISIFPGVAMSQIHLVEARWPLLRVDYPVDQPAGDDWQDHLRRLEVHLLRQDRFAVVLNLGEFKFDGNQRKAIEKVVKDHRIHCEKYLAGAAIVVKSKLQFAALNIISWINKPSFPVHIFTEVDAAEQWAFDQIGGGDEHDTTTQRDSARSESSPKGYGPDDS